MPVERVDFAAHDVRDIVAWMRSWVSGQRQGRQEAGYRGDMVDYLFAAVGLLHHQDLVHVSAEHEEERLAAVAALGAQAVTLREMSQVAANLAACVGGAGEEFADHPSVLGKPVMWPARHGTWFIRATTASVEELTHILQTGCDLLEQPAVSPLSQYLRGSVKHVDLIESELGTYEAHLSAWRRSLRADLGRCGQLSLQLRLHQRVAAAEALTDMVLAARPTIHAQLERIGERLRVEAL